MEKFYYNDGNQFGQQYKEHLVDYNQWDQQEHAEQWLVFPENVGPHLSIDETGLSNGELYPDIKKAYGLTHSLRMILLKPRKKELHTQGLLGGLMVLPILVLNPSTQSQQQNTPTILKY